ncbi:hypothetical protein BKA61DRAFT_631899 [Leptodontidium sp. MPI-SDFR-AT-0119]|nr:hypothetical protein BKA61DRAFT_631899 [Leptodontidium sp. MPI-SDFR-AT-0119]
MHLKLLALVAAVSTVAAQAPSFCDKYTTALFTDNTAANQYKLLVAVVNTAVIGNYSETKTGAVVPGILAPGQVGGVSVDLLPYFNGVLASTNQGGASGVSVNFLDDGGASPLKAGRPSNGKTSRQYLLLTHLYEFFGTLLGCSKQGGADFPEYSAHSSMYNVHKFMVLSPSEVTYFIEQVAASALSFGVTPEDIAPIGQVLMNLFGFRCSPPRTATPSQGDQPQSICSAPDCPIASNSTCVGSGGSGSGSSGSGSGSGGNGTVPGGNGGFTPTTVSTAGAAALGMSFVGVVGGAIAFFFL